MRHSNKSNAAHRLPIEPCGARPHRFESTAYGEMSSPGFGNLETLP
jgi:hypothetical protein